MNVKINRQDKSPLKSSEIVRPKPLNKTSKIIEVYKKQKATSGKNLCVDENNDFLNQDDKKTKAIIEIKENKIKELKEELRIKVQNKKHRDTVANIRVSKKLSQITNIQCKEKIEEKNIPVEVVTNRNQIQILNINANNNTSISPLQSLPNESFRGSLKTDFKIRKRDVSYYLY
jgi:hypothetical protein